MSTATCFMARAMTSKLNVNARPFVPGSLKAKSSHLYPQSINYYYYYNSEPPLEVQVSVRKLGNAWGSDVEHLFSATP